MVILYDTQVFSLLVFEKKNKKEKLMAYDEGTYQNAQIYVKPTLHITKQDKLAMQVKNERSPNNCKQTINHVNK